MGLTSVQKATNYVMVVISACLILWAGFHLYYHHIDTLNLVFSSHADYLVLLWQGPTAGVMYVMGNLRYQSGKFPWMTELVVFWMIITGYVILDIIFLFLCHRIGVVW